MEIQAIGARAFSVYIAGEELERRHLDPRSITATQARQIVSDVIRGDGMGAVSLELYPGRHEVLIFVKRSAGEPEFFTFPDLESLLEAVLDGGGDTVASLFYYGGRYILAVWAMDGKRPEGLAEFGTPLYVPGEYLLHLREHGVTVCDGDAVERLRETFGRRERGDC